MIIKITNTYNIVSEAYIKQNYKSMSVFIHSIVDNPECTLVAKGAGVIKKDNKAVLGNYYLEFYINVKSDRAKCDLVKVQAENKIEDDLLSRQYFLSSIGTELQFLFPDENITDYETKSMSKRVY
jgi:hypothetical protein